MIQMNKILESVLISLILGFLVQEVSTDRILCVIVNPSYSHQVFFQPLWRELAIRGHDVVVITSNPTNEILPHFKEIDTHETYASYTKSMDRMVNFTFLEFLWETRLSTTSIIKMMNQTIGLPQVQQLIRDDSQHFDLMIVEHMISPIFGLKKKYNCPLIGVASLDAKANFHAVMGNAVHSVLYPSAILSIRDNLSFWERVMAIVFSNMFDLLTIFSPMILAIETIAQESFGLTAQDIVNSFEDTDMLFVNTNPVLVPVRPHIPSTISVAGLHMNPPKPLPKNLKDYLDNAKEGVIYFSLGTNVKSNLLSLELRRVILETLSQVPYQILYKHEDDTLPGKPDNVRLIKWAPQQDILRHKNVKLFVTQGGIQSVEEAFYLNVPMVVIPFFGDQLPNAEKIKQYGLGIALNRHKLTAKEFTKAITDVIANSSYRNALKHYSNLVKDDPMTPLERAVWWTEYVLRHKGAKHLRGPRIPFYQYYYLDILAALGFALVLLFALAAFLIKCCFIGIKKMCGCSSGKNTTQPKKLKGKTN